MRSKKYAMCFLIGSMMAGILAGCGKVSDPQTKSVSFQKETSAVSETTPSKEQVVEYVRVWGPVLSVTSDSITIDNRSENGCLGEMILQLDPEKTRILDGENGYPEELSEIEKDDAVFAYIGQSMTYSLPGRAPAEVVFCDLPDSLRVPEFVRVAKMEQQSDGRYLMTTDSDVQYLIPENCEILPYLTRNLVTVTDIQPDSTCLVWRNEKLEANKIVLFAQ